MPDKLTKQDVYVPDPEGDYDIEIVGRGWQDSAKKLPGVYVLTGDQLHDFFMEYIHSDLPPHEFLKSKGVEI